MTQGSSKIATIAKAGEEAAKKAAVIRGRQSLKQLLDALGISQSQTGMPEADAIEDWTSLLIWLTEKGFRKDQLSKDENAVMLGIMCAVAENLARHAGENKAFCLMLTANACNRVFFSENPIRTKLLIELAQEQRTILGEYSQWREHLGDIAAAVDDLFKNGDGVVRMKVAIAINALLKSAWSILGMGKR